MIFERGKRKLRRRWFEERWWEACCTSTGKPRSPRSCCRRELSHRCGGRRARMLLSTVDDEEQKKSQLQISHKLLANCRSTTHLDLRFVDHPHCLIIKLVPHRFRDFACRGFGIGRKKLVDSGSVAVRRVYSAIKERAVTK